MKKIFVFIILSSLVWAIETEVFTKKRIFFEKDITNLKVLTQPAFSKYEIDKIEINSFVFSADTIGLYEIVFFDEFSQEIKEKIRVIGKTYTKESVKKILDTNAYQKGIKEIYTFSENPLDTNKIIYDYYLEKSRKKDNIDEILNAFLIVKKYFKNFEFEQKEFLEKLYNIKSNAKDTRAQVLILSFLKEYDKKYLIEHGRLALQVGINEKEALLDLENQVDKYLDTVAAEILANYYEKKSSKKAKKYLYIGNKKAFFNYLLKNNDEYSYIYYYEKLTADEKLEIDSIKEEFAKEKIIDLYLQKGNLNLLEQRYDIAKDYFGKVLSLSSVELKTKNALFSMAKINILEEKYDEALGTLEDYLEKYDEIDEVEALFYLGLCNFKLKNFEKSDIIFNQIKKTYKYSIWDEKIKILLKEI